MPWSSEEMAVFNVVNTILGSSSFYFYLVFYLIFLDSFSTGGPGKGMHSRTTKNCNLINKY